MFTWLKLGAVALVGAAAISIASYLVGRSDGKASVYADLKDSRITILENGKKIDAEALGADDAGLCDLLGGCVVPDQRPE